MLPVQLLLSSLLLAASPARACLVCEGPRTPPPRFNEQSSAPYNLKAEYALTDGELEHILGLEGGSRFRVRGVFLEDLSAPPESHLVNTGRVIQLLKEPSQKTFDELFKRYDLEVRAGKEPKLSAEDHSRALHLVWSRIALFGQKEAGFLRRLLPAKDLDPDLGCSPDREGLCVSSPGMFRPFPIYPTRGLRLPAALSNPQLPGVDELRDKLLHRLAFDDHGNAKEKAGLERLVDWLMLSPTARELAQELIDEGVTVKLSFEEMPNSKVVTTRSGQKQLYGTGGLTLSVGGEHHVKINRDYLKVTPLSFKTKAVSTLGHELFGHALKHIQAKKRNLTKAYHYYKNNETNAGVVGWIIGSEVSKKFRLTYTNSHMWNYVESPEKYRKKLEVTGAYYAMTMDPEEMKNPVPVLDKRLEAARAELVNVKKSIQQKGRWKRIIDHFIARHGTKYKPESFADILARIEKDLSIYLPNQEKNLKEIDLKLQAYIRFFKTSGGRRRIRGFGSEEAQAFLKGEEETLAKRTAQLKEILKKHNRKPPPAAVPAVGQIGWDELKRMLRDDLKKNPSHYQK